MTKRSAQKPAAKTSNVFGSDSSDDESEEGAVRKVNASLKKPGWVTKEVNCNIKALHFILTKCYNQHDWGDLNKVDQQ